MLRKEKKDNCLAVAMEIASVQAVCDFYALKLYNFLTSGDVISIGDKIHYSFYDLSKASHDINYFLLHLK